ncbi:MAG: glycosyltransferase [Crocinitomicaceae bacterium]|nr:glycosyltransferase [Crocinitomicaceae bacterium]
MATRFPFPIEKGDKLRTYYLLKSLHKTHDLYLISLSEETISEDQLNEIKAFTKEIHLFTLSKIGKYFRLILGLFNSKPLQVNYFTSFKKKREIENLLELIKPDHIICQLIRSAEYVKNYHDCPKTIDYMDALSKGMERRINKVNWTSKFIFQLEAKRLKDYERRIFNYFEFQTIISKQDRDYISHPDQKKMLVMPNGIDDHYFESLKVEIKYDLVFVGNLNYPPNIDAINYLVKEILPSLPRLKLLISGANPSKSLLLQLASIPNITITGWVDDIRESYLQGKILIAPMQIGTGMQNKILEAMALGVPSITTTLANNAIMATHQESIWVADTRESIIHGIETLLSNEAMYEKIKGNAKEFVRERYNWITIIQDLSKSIQI